MNVPSSTCPLRSERVTRKAFEGESVLLNLETGTAARELFDRATPLAAIGEVMCTRFDAPPAQVRQDLFELTQALMEEGLVRIREDPSTPSKTEPS
jgi:hypothetical protein